MKKRVLLLIMCVFAMTAANAQITSMAVVGAGVGGWPGEATNPGPIDNNQMTQVDAENWILVDLVVTGPGIKFRANNSWDDATATVPGANIGAPAAGAQWPSGVGVNAGSSSDIKVGVIPGTYTVKLNTTTNAYSFEGGAPIPVVKIVGSAVPGGELLVTLVGIDTFSVRGTFLDGTAQFDVDGVLQSAADFPSGSASEGGAPIAVTAGDWVVTFHYDTQAYDFAVPAIPIVSITGAGVGGWGVDTDLTTLDGVIYTINGLIIGDDGKTPPSSEIKFRQDNDWAIGWADAAWPSGTGNSGPANIPAVPGTYNVTFNRLTGEYAFTDVLSTKGFSSLNFKVFPNPTQGNWSFTSSNERIESIQIVDVLGKNVMTVSPKTNTANVDASNLTRGMYFAKIATAKATETIKLMKN